MLSSARPKEMRNEYAAACQVLFPRIEVAGGDTGASVPRKLCSGRPKVLSE